MAISLVGTAVGTTSATPPAHQAGDAFIVFAFRDGSTTRPTIPSGAGYVEANGGGANTCSATVCGKYAASSSETVGTFSNATSVILVVLRGVDLSTIFGGVNLSTGSSSTITYPSVTPQRTDGTSWILCFAGHRSADVAIETVPTGLTLLTSVSDATDEAAAFYLAGVTGNFTSRTASMGGTSSGWRSHSVEIRAAMATATAALADQADGVSAAGTVAISGAAALADEGDAVSAAGAAPVTGAALLVDEADSVSAAGTTVTGTNATAALIDEADGLSASGQVAVAATAALADGSDGVSSLGGIAVKGGAILADAGDGVSGAGLAAIAAAAALQDGADWISAAGRASVAGVGALDDGQDGVSAGGRVGLTGFAALDDGADGLAGAGAVAVTASADLLDSEDQVLGAGTIAEATLGGAVLVARAPGVRIRRAVRPNDFPLVETARRLGVRVWTARQPSISLRIARRPR